MTDSMVTAAQVTLVAAALFLVLLVMVHFIKREFDPSWRMISEYEIGRNGWIMRLAFVCWSVSVFTIAVALRPYASVTGEAALVITAVALLGAAIFATDPITTPWDSTSVAHRLHAVFGSLFIFGFPITVTIVDWNVANSAVFATPHAWPGGMSLLVWIGWITYIASTVVFASKRKGQAGPDVLIGWPNRFMVVAYVAWLVVAAWTIIRR